MTSPTSRVALRTIAHEWTRIGATGFGGPPTHIALLRQLCVEKRSWIKDGEFEDAMAATNLLPGPASTQLAIFCAWRLRGRLGALVGAIAFIAPGLILILALSAAFLAQHPPRWLLGVAAGSGAAVPAVAINAALLMVPPSWQRIGSRLTQRGRWSIYCILGAASAITLGPYLVLLVVTCGVTEILVRHPRDTKRSGARAVLPVAGTHLATGGLGALIWVAFKIGALSYGGGFVIVPLMQHDAVNTYHWMTNAQFLNAVALGQVTPGPVVQTVAVVGYAAGGVTGGLIAAFVAFTPSFLFVVLGASHFDRIRRNTSVQAFLTDAGAAVIGAIAGSAVSLGLALEHLWQLPLLAAAAVSLFVFRRGVVSTLLITGAAGAILVIVGAPV